ncbi:metal-dependent hydrolase [Natronoarchaeum sp. GCM10025703]|uniref:metal-dependent hydrolase n=1 Tax=unclassified Natronoarchaeum TaxID=2620183 RepID=UPI0036130D7C
MYRGGHIGLNAALYALVVPTVSRHWSLEVALFGAALTVGLANIPDLDQPLPRLRHRGGTHTIWFALLVGALTGIVMTALVGGALASVLGFAIGASSILAHLAGDVVTPMGLRPLAPLSRRHVTLDWFKSKNRRVNRTVLFVGVVLLLTSLALTSYQLSGVL